MNGIGNAKNFGRKGSEKSFMEEIKAYKPSCCNKAYIYKSSAKRHENKCFKNPDNRSCLSCGNFIKDSNTIYVRPVDGHDYGDDDYEEPYWYCNHDENIHGNAEVDYSKEFQYHCKHWTPRGEAE